MIIVADNDSRHYRSQYYYLFADLLGMKPTLFCTFFTKKTQDRKWWPLWSRHRSNIVAIIFEGSSYSFLFISCHSFQKEYIRSIMVTMKVFKKSMKIIPRRYPYYLDDLMNGALQGVAPRVRMDRCGRLEVAWNILGGRGHFTKESCKKVDRSLKSFKSWWRWWWWSTPFFPASISFSFFFAAIWIGEKDLYYPDGFSGSNILYISSL